MFADQVELFTDESCLVATSTVVFTTSVVSAHSPLNGTKGIDLRLAAVQSIRDLARKPQVVLSAQRHQASPPNRSWVKRHPALSGAIVGAVAGAMMVGTATHRSVAWVEFHGGAAAGKMVGWTVSR